MLFVLSTRDRAISQKLATCNLMGGPAFNVSFFIRSVFVGVKIKLI